MCFFCSWRKSDSSLVIYAFPRTVATGTPGHKRLGRIETRPNVLCQSDKLWNEVGVVWAQEERGRVIVRLKEEKSRRSRERGRQVGRDRLKKAVSDVRGQGQPQDCKMKHRHVEQKQWKGTEGQTRRLRAADWRNSLYTPAIICKPFIVEPRSMWEWH